MGFVIEGYLVLLLRFCGVAAPPHQKQPAEVAEAFN